MSEQCNLQIDPLRVVHLPVYHDNPYQLLLMENLTACGVNVIDGGGGGNFLRTALRKWKADIYHFHWLHPYLLRAGSFSSGLRATRFLFEMLVLRLSGARLVWTIHNLTNHERRLGRLERFYSIIFARLVSGVIVHSKFALGAADETFNLRPSLLKAVIPQGGYAGHYPNQMSRPESRSRLGLSSNDMVFLFLGRIQPYKGVLQLIRCFRELSGDVRLLVVGKTADAASRQALLEAIKDKSNIRLCEGFVSDDMMQMYFNAADVYVFPVRDILNSGSIALAMSFGLPCIAPRLGGLSEMLGENGGILYDPAQSDGLQNALHHAIQRRTELPEMGRDNLRRAMDWTWDKVAARTADLYKKLITLAV